MSPRVLFQTVVSLVSIGLGNYVLYGVYTVLSGNGAEMYPEAATVFQQARAVMPFDTAAGLFLILWPFYYAAKKP